MKLLLPGVDRNPASPVGQPLSALEEALHGEDADTALAQALAALEGIDQRLRTSAAQGLPPAEYAMLAGLLDACKAARETLTMHARTS